MTDKEVIKLLVSYINTLVEGDDPEPEMSKNMYKLGFWDIDGFPIDEDEMLIDDL